MSPASFQIVYENPRAPVAPPELYEGYDVVSAFYDYLPSGTRATVVMDDYTLEMPGVKFVDLVRRSLPLAESLIARPPDTSADVRTEIAEIPPEANVYTMWFADFMFYFPYLIFATDGDAVRIYTRTLDESEGHPLIVHPDRDRADPVVLPQRAVLDEIRTFLTRYLNDLVTAFPFLESDDLYREYRRRTDALAK